MSAADSLYQQLRGHLAYLKLAAAAEALPAALDQAAAEKLNHTEFLHRLLAIEVDATEARRHAGRLRFANFPAPWRLEDYDFTAQPSVDPALMRDLASCRPARRRQDPPRHRPRPRRRRCRTTHLLLHRRRPRRALPASCTRGPLGHHHAVLQRTDRVDHR